MFSIVTDDVQMPGGAVASRDYMRHVGAVGVVALDDEDRVVLVRQYRHPVACDLWELPAGLIDVPGEPLDHAAARELAEEADLVAADWQLLVDVHTSPGCSNEVIRLFLARGLTDGAGRRAAPPRARGGRSSPRGACRSTRRSRWSSPARSPTRPPWSALLAAARLRDQGWPETRPLDTPLPPR